MPWSDIERAMQVAICRASGYAPERVIWSYQNRNAPELDYISIHFGGEIMVGVDRVSLDLDLNRQPGQEFAQEIQGTREVPFEISCFTSSVIGEAAARRVLEITRTKLRLPDVRYGLRRVGISPFDPGPVDYVPNIPAAGFRGRATCTIRCYVPVMDCVEYVGYIATMNGRFYPSGWNGASGVSGIAFAATVG